MLRSKLIAPALSVVCLFGMQAVIPSLAMASESPLRAIIAASPIAGAKMIKLNLVNNMSASLDVKIGETPLTIAAGETVKVSAPNGAKIVYTSASTTHEAGSVMAQVSKDMAGATIRIN